MAEQQHNNIDKLLTRARRQKEEETSRYEYTFENEINDIATDSINEESQETTTSNEVFDDKATISIEDEFKPFLNKYGNLNTISFIVLSLVILVLASYWNTFYSSQLRSLSEREEYLKDLRYRDLFTTAELVRLGRIGNIENSLKELGLTLEHSTQPPYEIIDTMSTPQEK